MTKLIGEVQQTASELIGLPCTLTQNPLGSVLLLDFGPLAVPHGHPEGAAARGFRSLSVYCPWRLDSPATVLCDWNWPGGADGKIRGIMAGLIGAIVSHVEVELPSGDLQIQFANGMRLTVFVDSDREEDDAWCILGTDGREVAVQSPAVG